VPWQPIQEAIQEALGIAAQVDQVRLPDERRTFDRAQRLDVEFELEALGDEGEVDVDLGDEGLAVAVEQDMLITARIYAQSTSHSPDVSAYELAYRLVTRAHLPEVLDVLEAGGLALVRVGRAVPGPPLHVDNRWHSAVSLSWDLQHRACEQEGQPPAPRPYFDRVEVGDEDGPRQPRAIAPDIAQAEVLDVADWRSLWLGTQTDLVGGRAWSDDEFVAHNQEPGADVGDGVLTRASAIEATVAAVSASDPDAGVLRDGLAIALVLRGPAPPATARVLGRAGGWTLRALTTGALRFTSDVGGEVLEVPGVLGGATPPWVVVVLAQVAGVTSLRALASSDSAPVASSYADAPLTLGAGGAEPAPEGLELALVGEAETDDPAALLAALRAALGL
jgi:hypothetical protein